MIRNFEGRPSSYVDDAWVREEQVKRQRRLILLRARILEQAAGDTFDLVWKDGAVRVPRAPFENWCLRRTTLAHLAPPWEPVAGSGLKMNCDDPYHSDWWVGAGLDPDDAYGVNDLLQFGEGTFQSAMFVKMHEVQERYGGFQCVVLVGGAERCGRVEHGARAARAAKGAVVVVPNLHPAYFETILDAAAVITEAGGAVAHLVESALTRGIPTVRVADARKRYPPGTEVRVDPAHGLVETVWKYR